MRDLSAQDMIKRWYIFLLLLLPPLISHGQEDYSVSQDSRVILSGSSSLGDWESRVKSVSGLGRFTLSDDELLGIDSLIILFNAASISSEISKIDSIARIVLKTKNFPVIKFVMQSNNLSSGNQLGVRGKMDIAGVGNDITLFATYFLSDSDIIFSGNYTLDMDHYDIIFPFNLEPKILVDNLVNVNFDIVFKR